MPIGLHLIQQSDTATAKHVLSILQWITPNTDISGLLQTQTTDPLEDVVALLEHINMASDIWYGGIDLANTFFSILRKKGKERTFISLKSTTGYLTRLCWGWVNTLGLCQNSLKTCRLSGQPHRIYIPLVHGY